MSLKPLKVSEQKKNQKKINEKMKKRKKNHWRYCLLICILLVKEQKRSLIIFME